MRLERKAKWFCIPLLVLIALLLFHSQYSFCQSDESFYIAIVNRLYHGDRLLIDEWHPSQSYAPLLVPLYALYHLFVPSGAGVLLFFRIAYILFAGAIALWFYALFHKRFGVWLTLCAAMLCLLYSRANIAGMSYYCTCFQFSLASFLCITASMEATQKNKVRFFQISSGILMACAVLSSPYLAVFVVIGLVAMLCWKRTRSLAVHMSLGIIGSAILYAAFYIDLFNIPTLLANLPHVFRNPQHTKTFDVKFDHYWGSFRHYLTTPMAIIECIFCLYITVSCVLKKHISSLAWTLYIACVIAFIYPTLRGVSHAICHIFLFPFSVYMFPLIWQHLLQKKNIVPVAMYVFGFCIRVAFFLASTTVVDAMTVGWCFSSVGVILAAKTLFDGQQQGAVFFKQILACALGLLLLTMVGLSGANKFIGIYRDAPLQQLTVRLEKGPAKGLLTAPTHAKQYNSIYDTVTQLAADDPNATVLHTYRLPWAYFSTDWRYGAPSVGKMEISSEWLLQYYQLHPDRIPDYVFVYAPEVGQTELVLFNNHPALIAPSQNDFSGEFYEYMQANGSIILSTEYVTVYKLNNN